MSFGRPDEETYDRTEPCLEMSYSYISASQSSTSCALSSETPSRDPNQMARCRRRKARDKTGVLTTVFRNFEYFERILSTEMGRPNKIEFEDARSNFDCTKSAVLASAYVSIGSVAQTEGSEKDCALITVLPYLSARLLGMMHRTNKRFSTQSEAWKILCHRDFGILRASDAISWKETYKMAWNEWVVWHEGKPDYVRFLGSGDGCQGVWSKLAGNGNTVEVMITM